MFRASFFKLNMFERCPRQYRLYYIDGLKDIYGKPRPYFTMGDHVHAALKEFLSVVPTSARNTSRLEDLLREKWHLNRRGFNGLEDEKNWGEKALNQLRWFAQSQDLSITPLLVEDYHKAELSTDITLVGRIDRVDDEGDGAVHVIDYKTGRMPAHINETQLYIYSLILSKEQNLTITKASYLYLEAGQLRSLTPTAADLDEATSYVIDLVERISVERDFPATPNDYCWNCDFLEVCPRQEEAINFAAGEDAPVSYG